MKIIKSLPKFLLISLFVYIGICLTLIYWPTPSKKNIENYDYSSLNDATVPVALGEEGRAVLRDGKPLFYRLYESNSDTTLVLLHGSGSDSRYLRKIATYLAKNDITRVITPDLRGHGRNEGSRGDIDYIGQLDHDVEDLLTYTQNKYQGTNVVLGGHSSGGGMVLRYVGNESVKQPSAILLFAPYLGHESPTVKPNSGEWVTVAIKRWVGLSMINNLGITAFDDLPVLLFNRPEEWNDNLQVASYSYRMAVNFAPNSYIDDIAKIDMPTLVLIGQDDESFHPEKFEDVFEASKKNVNVHIVTNANHMNILDTDDSKQHVVNWFDNVALPNTASN